MKRTYLARGMVCFALFVGGCKGGGGGSTDASVPIGDLAIAADLASQGGIDLEVAIPDASLPIADLAIAADLALKGGIDYEWARWKMPNPATEKLPNPSSYDTGTPGIVRDKVTGLIWQHPVDPNSYTWADAGAYCAHLGLDGGGWRLPTKVELYSLIDHTQPSQIDPVAFPNSPAEVFWSSSLLAGNLYNAWNVNFYNAYSTAGYSVVGDTFRVRCVR